MKRTLFSLIVLLAFAIAGCNQQLSVVAPGAQIRKLASGFEFTEGPVADAHGNVYFTDIPNSRIHKWSPDSGVAIFVDQTGEANGLYFDSKGNLIACQGGAR
ncbi:MAG: SMP-30/gluconolactonase/LRE family protein, partial [Planctomycetota bacterium]